MTQRRPPAALSPLPLVGGTCRVLQRRRRNIYETRWLSAVSTRLGRRHGCSCSSAGRGKKQSPQRTALKCIFIVFLGREPSRRLTSGMPRLPASLTPFGKRLEEPRTPLGRPSPRPAPAGFLLG